MGFIVSLKNPTHVGVLEQRQKHLRFASIRRFFLLLLFMVNPISVSPICGVESCSHADFPGSSHAVHMLWGTADLSLT